MTETPREHLQKNRLPANRAIFIRKSTKKKEDREEIVFQLVEEMMSLSFLILSIPSQLLFLLAYNAMSGLADLTSKLFNNVKESGQRVVDLLEKMRS